jgi:hypothetical protein
MSDTDGRFDDDQIEGDAIEDSEAAPGSGPGAPPDTEEESAAEPGTGPGAPQQ